MLVTVRLLVASDLLARIPILGRDQEALDARTLILCAERHSLGAGGPMIFEERIGRPAVMSNRIRGCTSWRCTGKSTSSITSKTLRRIHISTLIISLENVPRHRHLSLHRLRQSN